jgi:hypothetical protein
MFPLCLLFAAATQGQIQIAPQPAPPGIRKLVVLDQGDLWPIAMARHLDGSVTVFGNPWLGGASLPLPGLSGVLDLARLDAFTPGDTESVAAVGSSGLTMVRWDATSRGFVLTPVVDPALAGAPIVRAAPFAPFHMLSVVTADRLAVRSYRGTGTHLSTINQSSPVRDLELFQHANGSARLLVRTDSGLACHGLNGNLFWSLPGHGGVLVRWPQSATVRAAWLHQPAPGGNWQVAMLGDSGVLSTSSLAHAFAPGESLKAAFAADADLDTDLDLVVKAGASVSVLLVPASGDFGQSTELLHELTPNVASVPDLIATNAGQTLRYVDSFAGGVAWEEVQQQTQSLLGSGLSLHVVPPAGPVGSSLGGSVDRSITSLTHIDFKLRSTPNGLSPFVSPTTQTRIQIVAWIHDKSSGSWVVNDQSESNLLLTLNNPTSALQGNWLWSTWVNLVPQCTDMGWSQHRYYWLTVRLCKTPIGSNVPIVVSEPITLVTSMSMVENGANWSFLVPAYFPSVDTLPRVSNPPQIPNGGGGVVGVIQRIDLPPPPPPSGIPSPRANTSQGVVNGAPAGN